LADAIETRARRAKGTEDIGGTTNFPAEVPDDDEDEDDEDEDEDGDEEDGWYDEAEEAEENDEDASTTAL